MSKRNNASLIFRALVATAFVCAQASFPVFAAGDDSDILRKAISSYNAGNYRDAIGYVEMYLPEHQNDAMAHYYLANSYRSLGLDTQARREYFAVFRCHPDPQIREYAKLGIESFNQRIRAAEASAPVTIYTNAHPATPKIEFLPSRTGYSPSSSLIHNEPTKTSLRHDPRTAGNGYVNGYGDLAPDPNDAQLNKALSHMEEQAAGSAANYQIQNSASGQGTYYDSQIAKTLAQRDERINYLQANPTYSSKGRLIERTSEINEAKAQADAQIKSYKYMQENEARAGKVRMSEEAENYQTLVRQYEQEVIQARVHPGKDSPNLQVVGTDLYTRNYGPRASGEVKPPAEPDELLAQQERLILDAHSHPGETLSRVVKDPLPSHRVDPNTDLKVHGQVMP